MSVVIGVIGASSCDADISALAEGVGRRIAERGGILVCGGLGGVMEASARGARQAGGLTIGILPGGDPAAANPFIDVPVATGIGLARNVVIVRTAGALIAVSGGYGTLSEIAHALALGKPVIGLQTWAQIPEIQQVGSADEAVAAAFRCAESG